MAICAVLACAESWEDIALYGRSKLSWLRQFLPLPHGIPSHDTFRRVFMLIDPDAFETRFSAWVGAIMTPGEHEVVAIDGKALRRSFDRGRGQSPLHLVSAWASEQGLVLGQRRVDDKSNEITAIPELLESLVLENTLVTLDAMGCQKDIAQRIVDRQADYLLVLKANHGNDYAAVQSYFEQHCFGRGATPQPVFDAFDDPGQFHALALAQVVADPNTCWTGLTVPRWYSQPNRRLELTSGTAVWYHTGKPPVPIRWVLVRDPPGKFDPQAFLCTRLETPAPQILTWFVPRWLVEVTFQEVRTHLGVETQRQWSDLAIARTTPTLLALFSMVTLLAHHLSQQQSLPLRTAAWYTKAQPTFSDALAAVRARVWQSSTFCRSVAKADRVKIPALLLERLTEALCYAA